MPLARNVQRGARVRRCTARLRRAARLAAHGLHFWQSSDDWLPCYDAPAPGRAPG
jgi:hypothetical protein